MTAGELDLLIIEDSPSDAMLLHACLRAGLLEIGAIERAHTLESGLARVEQGGIDLLLLDLGLPDSEGLETIREVATRFPDVPVIIVSGLEDSRVAEEALALGAQDFVVKNDLTPKVMDRAVAYAVQRHRTDDEIVDLAPADIGVEQPVFQRVSTGLRAPLAAVRQFVSVVSDETAGPLTGEQRESIDQAMRSVQQLAGMIDELVDVTPASFGHFPLRAEVANVDELIEGSVAAVRPLAERTGVTLDVELDGLRDAWCDPARVAEVLDNLLYNAIESTPSGGWVTVTSSGVGDEIQVAVQDSGPGVRPENRGRVFEPSFRDEPPEDPQHGGPGLELFVCRDLIERQGGRIWLDCAPHTRGSRVTFTVPVFAGRTPSERPEHAPVDGTSTYREKREAQHATQQGRFDARPETNVDAPRSAPPPRVNRPILG
jgi:sigma-B regulation protein RsbU (phosphoserine phosphatase)